jgi:hypothetical protein
MQLDYKVFSKKMQRPELKMEKSGKLLSKKVQNK